MQAVIMAGGFGTRLRPLTMNLPKPMTPLLNRPIIEHNVELLRLHNITDLVIILYHQAEIIKEYFGDGSDFGVKIKYVKPDADYGTAGAVYRANDLINERFIIISGDVVTDFDISKSINFHTKKSAIATIVLAHSKNPLQFGIVLTDKDNKITKFYEKPSWSEVFSDTINTGIYILEKEAMEMIPKARASNRQDIDFSKDLYPYMLKHKMGLYGAVENGYWKDVGSLEDYIATNLEALKGKVKLPWMKLNPENKNFIGKGTKVSKTAELTNCVIGSNCIISANARIKNSVIWNNSVIGENAKINRSVICSGVNFGDGASAAENNYIGDKVKIGKDAQLKSDVKIWPGKIIDGDSIVMKNIVWEDRWRVSLFTDSRITGLANIEITPEFASKLGTIFGVFTGIGSRVSVSRDMDNMSKMIKNSIISGLMSAGIQIADLQVTPIPMLRQELKSGKGSGGVFVRKSPFDPTRCDIIFIDSNGKDLSSAKTKTIERMFFAEDHNPVPAERIGSVMFPERTNEYYREQFISNLNKDLINDKGFKIAINYSFGITSSIFPLVTSDLNLELVSLDSHIDVRKQLRNAEEFNDALKKLSFIVTSLNYDAGFLIDAGGEKIFVVDDKGVIYTHDRFLTIATALFLEVNPNAKKIAVPIQASTEIDVIAKNYGTEVLRVKDSHFAMMNAADDPEVAFIGGTKGGIIFPKFLYATDGMFAVVKIIEMLAAASKKLSRINEETPQLYLSKNNLYCSKEQKGKIMRGLVEISDDKRRQLIDGIKIFFEDDKWVLCIPDSEREIFHVNAEAPTRKEADKLVKEYSKLIKELQS